MPRFEWTARFSDKTDFRDVLFALVADHPRLPSQFRANNPIFATANDLQVQMRPDADTYKAVSRMICSRDGSVKVDFVPCASQFHVPGDKQHFVYSKFIARLEA